MYSGEGISPSDTDWTIPTTMAWPEVFPDIMSLNSETELMTSPSMEYRNSPLLRPASIAGLLFVIERM